jgi:ribosomal protein L24E
MVQYNADGKSHSGIAISLGKGAVYVRSAKQVLVTKSSAETELVAASDELSQVICWLREFLIAQGYPPKCCYFYQDNMSTMAMITKGRHTSLRSRHINVRYFFIGDRVEKGEITMKHCKSDDMIADIMTKPLQGYHFRIARQLSMNII